MMSKKILLIFFNLLIINLLIAQTNITGSFEIDNRTRDYRLHLPPDHDISNEYPLVINMHGLGSNAFEQEIYSNFNRISNANNFIVVYPNGVNSSWNSGFGTGVDDVKFLSALIDTIDINYNVDLTRVYSTGMSNGGFMSYSLACELSDRIAAIASVTGSMTRNALSNCNPNRPVPVLQFHGTDDNVVPYNGNGQITGIEEVISYWIEQNTCNNEAVITAIEDSNMEDESTVDFYAYNGCIDEPRVELYRIENGGHTWPGTFIELQGQVTNQDIDASELIWAFFNRFTNDDAPLSATEELVTMDIRISPNPTQDMIFITNDTPLETIQLFSMNGKLIQTCAGLQQKSIQFSIKDIETGMYFLKIQTKSGFTTQKIIKH